MSSATDRLEFAPPPAKASPRAIVLAVLVHLLLIAALTWGVSWKRSDDAASFEAELWSNVALQAAPKAAQPALPIPTPTPEPTPEPAIPAPQPSPVPRPTPAPQPPPPPTRPPEASVSPTVPDVDIALEQEKKRKKQQQLKLAEAQKAEKAEKLREQREQREAELQAKKDKEKKLEKEREREKEKELAKKEEKALKAKEALATRKAQEDAQRAEAKKQDAKDQEKQRLADAKAEKQKLATAAAEKTRQDNIKRMMGQAGATGAASAKGSAQRSSGPRGNSTTYGAIVTAAIKPNVIFTDDIAGNPTAKVEVRLTLDGTVISQRLIESSGNKAWDDAAIKAIIRTGVMPKDIDGRIPDTILILEMKPKN